MEMEYNRVQRQQRRRFGVLFVGGVLLVGVFFLWGEPEEHKEAEAPDQTPPSHSVEAPIEPETHETVPVPAATSTPEAEPPTAQSDAASLPATEQTPSRPASPQVETPAAEKESIAAEREDEDVEQPREGTPSAPTPTGVISASRLNVRQRPSLAADRIATLLRGEQVTILDEEGNWYRIRAREEALEGWVAKRYVDTNTAQEALHSS